MRVRNQIKSHIVTSLSEQLDDMMAQSGFKRVKNSLVYKKIVAHAVQKIDMKFEIHPSDNRNAATALYPILEVKMPAVDEVLEKIVDGNYGLLEGVTFGVSRQPIEITSAKAKGARWYIYQADSIPSVVSELKMFLEKWTLPLLENYLSPEDIILLDESNDPRILRDRAQIMRVIVATLHCKGPEKALERLEKSFGSRGLRRRYKQVYDFIQQSLIESA